MAVTDPIPRMPLTDAVHDRILELIMDGTLAPGDSIRVVPLAQELGVSQTPVREALGRLAGSGIIVRSPMRGFTVAPVLDQQEIEELTAARMLLECEIAARATGMDGLDERLATNLENIRAVSVGPTYEEYRAYLELSAEFHELIAEAGGNRFLSMALDALPVHVQRFRLFGSGGVDDVEESIAEHEAIRVALASGDPDRARAAMEAHISGVAARAGAAETARDGETAR